MRVFRIGRPLEAVEDFGLFLGSVPLLPVTDPVFQERYGCREELFWEERLRRGTNRMFLPVREEGLYVVAVKGEEGEERILVSVTRLGLLAKRSRDGLVAGVFDRMEGQALEGVALRFRLPDKRHKVPVTDRDGLVRLSSEMVRYADRLVAVRSNSLDIVPLPPWQVAEEPEVKVLAVPARIPLVRGEDASVDIFVFRKDQFREYGMERSFAYEAVWQGRTNRGTATEGVGRVDLGWAKDVPAGMHALDVRAGGGKDRLMLPVVERRSGGGYLELELPSVVTRRRPLRTRVAVRNAGHRRIRLAEVEWRASQGKRTVEGRRSRMMGWPNRMEFRIPWDRFDAGPVRIFVGARLADGEWLREERMVVLEEGEERVEISLGRRVLSVVEPVSVDVSLSSRKASSPMRVTVEFRLAGERQAESKLALVRGPGTTNIRFYPRRNGLYEVQARPARGKAVRDVFWVIPDRGSLRGTPEDEVGIVTDRDEYGYGEIARVLLFAPRRGWEGLLTFEGETLFVARTVRFEERHVVLDLPVTEANRPNGFLVLQSFRSNRLVSAVRRVDIPAKHKRVYYQVRTEPLPGGRKVTLRTRNMWGRPIRVYSFIRVGPEGWSFWPPFPDFYGPIPNKVLSCGREIPTVSEAAGSDGGGTVWGAGPRDTWPEIEEAEVFRFPDAGASNVLALAESRFPQRRSVELVCRSLGDDGKTGFFRTPVGLDQPVSFRFLVPPRFSDGDRPAVGAGLRNLMGFGREVSVTVAFEGSAMILYRTNRLFLGPGEERRMVIPFPSEVMGDGRLAIVFECRTPESVLRRVFLTGRTEGRRPERPTVRKRLRRVVPGWPKPLVAEEAVTVLLEVRRDERMPGSLVRDEVPAGFRPVEWSVREAGGWTDGRFVWFPPGVRKARYLMRAVVPGVWSLPEAVLTDGEDRETVRPSRPRRIRVGL